MDKQLDVCFDRVEKALSTLVDSISKYHPSVHQVNELGLADIELNKGLEDLQTHQSNYRRIQDLRAATASFDAQIKETLRLLANTRKELVSAPATVFPSDVPSYDINYDELLAYARRISRTTLPPAAIMSPETTQANSGAETGVATPADGITPNGAPAPQPNGVPVADPSSQPPNPAVTTTNAAGETNLTALPEELQWHMNPYSNFSFVPWPPEEEVRQGALSSLAFLYEQGIDAENYDPETEKQRKRQEEEEAKAAQERERQEREERERRAREEQARVRAEREKEQREAWRRASISGGAGAGGPGVASSPVGEKKQFQFMADDDEDDDE
ncbi:hypothetical protein F5B19DRAFT_475059 [Rostrohypoxylon terebratum]|nr:hypothetical protein F5B19DRAFT_475059 [Rostrohypoxylon terebratum]